jgi:hypothetical protein
VCLGTEQGPHSKSNYQADFKSEIRVVVGSRSAPVGTPPDLRSNNKVRRIAETIKGSRFDAYSQRGSHDALSPRLEHDDALAL